MDALPDGALEAMRIAAAWARGFERAHRRAAVTVLDLADKWYDHGGAVMAHKRTFMQVRAREPCTARRTFSEHSRTLHLLHVTHS